MHIRTIGPMFSPLVLRAGLNPRSPGYERVLAALPTGAPGVSIPAKNDAETERRDFADSRQDDLDLRLFVWRPETKEGEPQLTCHVFPAGVCVIECAFALDDITGRPTLEEDVQAVTRETFDRHAATFSQLLQKTARAMPEDLLAEGDKAASVTAKDFGWIARAVMMTGAEAQAPEHRRFLADWLEHTARPEEAEAIAAGDLDASMTWLNYVIVEDDPDLPHHLFAAARVAQFFYAAQTRLNEAAQEALVDANSKDQKVAETETNLIEMRRRMQLLRILCDTQKGFLSRQRRRKFDDLMDCWDYDILVRNGERIVEASTAKIGEIVAHRARASASAMQVFLGAIGLFAIFELFLYLVEFSREVMSRPALGFEDAEPSWILSFFARFDIDWVLLAAALFVVVGGILIGVWTKKSR